MNGYRPNDQLYLWWLGNPSTPVFIGTLHLLRGRRGVSLRYANGWLQNGFALSEDLPLVDIEHAPVEPDTAAGAVDDARPDRWGERVIRILDKPPRLSLLEYLYFAGDDRSGALGVSLSAGEYVARRSGPLPTLGDVEDIQKLVRKVLRNESLPEEKRRLLAPGSTMGGARPKGLIEVDQQQWVVKFNETDPWDAPLVEHACMTLAAQAGITVAETFAIRLADGHALAVRRFDRAPGARLHAQSANVALRAEGSRMGYAELSQLLRRRAPVEGGVAKSQMREVFRRMVFNVIMDNTDDHEKNHMVLMDDAQHLRLSPAFDVLPTCQSLGYQQMRVGTEGNDSTIENALSEAPLFSMTRDEAVAQVARVAAVCARWSEHFRSLGVVDADVQALSAHIDRPFLADQRREFARLPS